MKKYVQELFFNEQNELKSSLSYSDYKELLKLIEIQKFDEISYYLNMFRDTSNFEIELIRRLFSYRISLLNGNTDLEFIKTIPTLKFSWINAEIYFVNGLISFHKSDFNTGEIFFESAAKLYKKKEIYDRYLLSLFNIYVARVNSNKLSNLIDRLNEIHSIERLALQINKELQSKSNLALILREKSVLYYQLEKFRASHATSVQAADLFRESGTLGDWHLCLLLASLTAHKISDKDMSLLYLEQLIPPFETRVQFGYDVLNYIINKKNKPNPNSYSAHSPFWLEQLEIHMKVEKNVSSNPNQFEFIFDINNYKIISLSQNKVFKLSPRGLEWKLISLFLKTKEGRLNRHFLIENLWPDSSRTEQLDNRLHQLIYRIKSKYHLEVQFDGAAYALKNSLMIE